MFVSSSPSEQSVTPSQYQNNQHQFTYICQTYCLLVDIQMQDQNVSVHTFKELLNGHNIIFFTQPQMIFKVQFGKQIHLVNSSDKPRIDQFLSVLPSVFKTLPNKYSLSYLDEDGDEITLKDQSDYAVLLKSGLKTVRITIRESNEEFIEANNQVQFEDSKIQIIQQKISEIKILDEESVPAPKMLEEKSAPKQTQMEMEVEQPEISDHLIEEKLKKMLPSIINQIKDEISEEFKEKSRYSLNNSCNNEPFIVEESIIKQPRYNRTETVVHERVNCDGCGKKGIVGIRYKCAICPDFDFCERCEATTEHDHPFLKIKNLRQTPSKIIAIIDDEDESLEINGQRNPIPPCLSNLINQGYNIVEGFLGNQSNQQMRKMFDEVYKNTQAKQEEKPKEKQTVPEKKEEPKAEKIIEQARPHDMRKESEERKQPQKMELESSYEGILRNASYLVQVFDLPMDKCISYAQKYPRFSREELLDYFVSHPESFYEKQ